MNDEDVKILETMQAERPLILTTRKFRRSAPLGMKVWRAVTRNFDYSTEVEHVELACPGYTLTNSGPVHKRKEDTDDE